MNGRRDRILVPSAVALTAIGTTIWLASGGEMSPIDWLHGFSDETLKFLVGAGVITVGIGYLCNALFTLWMLLRQRCRLVDLYKLMSAFGLWMDPPDKKFSCRRWLKQRKEWRRLEEELLDEFHLRLHSHAPQSLIDYCSRRNTAWYVANTSAYASLLGCLVALTIVFASHGCIFTTSFIAYAGLPIFVFIIVIPLALFWQGARWNREFWGVCWRWIGWDRQTHSPGRGWLSEPLPEGVFMSESESHA